MDNMYKGGYVECYDKEHRLYGGEIFEEDFCTDRPTYSVIERIIKDMKFNDKLKRNKKE